MSAALRFIVLYAALALVVSSLALLQLWPWRPTTALGWLALLLLALPITATGEWLGRVLLENRFSARLGNNRAPASVSWLRIAYGIVAVLCMLAIFAFSVYVAATVVR